MHSARCRTPIDAVGYRPSDHGETGHPAWTKPPPDPVSQVVFCPVCFVGILEGDFKCPRCGRRFRMVEIVK